MARKDTKQSKGPDQPNLVVSRSQAADRIREQIKKGKAIIDKPVSPLEQLIRGKEELEQAETECSKWSQYNIELLKRLFDADSFANRYAQLDVLLAVNTKTPNDLHKRIEKDIVQLESILERLELIPELTQESHDELNAATTNKGYSEKSLQSISLKAAKITFVAAVITLIGAVLTSPLWIPVINKIFGDSGESTKICTQREISEDSSAKAVSSDSNSLVHDHNAPGSKKLQTEPSPIISRDEEFIQPVEIEGDVNRPKISPIFKIPDRIIDPEETAGEVNEPKKSDLIKRREKTIEPEDE